MSMTIAKAYQILRWMEELIVPGWSQIVYDLTQKMVPTFDDVESCEL